MRGQLGPDRIKKKIFHVRRVVISCPGSDTAHPGRDFFLRQLNERDRQALGGMPRPPAADGLQALGYVIVHSPNSEDLLFSITAAGRAALATIGAET